MPSVSEWHDIPLASALQLFNVEITFKHVLPTHLDFCDLPCLSIKWGSDWRFWNISPFVFVSQSLLWPKVFRWKRCWNRFRPQPVQSNLGALYYLFTKESCFQMPLPDFHALTSMEIATTTSASRIPVWQLILRMINESCESRRDPPPTPKTMATS